MQLRAFFYRAFNTSLLLLRFIMGRNDPPELDEQPMLGSVFFNRNRRPQDVAWKWLYIVSVLLTFAGGLYALTHR